MHGDERGRRAGDRLLEVAAPDPVRTGDHSWPAVGDAFVEGGDDVEDLAPVEDAERPLDLGGAQRARPPGVDHGRGVLAGDTESEPRVDHGLGRPQRREHPPALACLDDEALHQLLGDALAAVRRQDADPCDRGGREASSARNGRVDEELRHRADARTAVERRDRARRPATSVPTCPRARRNAALGAAPIATTAPTERSSSGSGGRYTTFTPVPFGNSAAEHEHQRRLKRWRSSMCSTGVARRGVAGSDGEQVAGAGVARRVAQLAHRPWPRSGGCAHG